MTQGKSPVAWLSRRKIGIFAGLVLLTILFFTIREKYFYRADVLKAVVAVAPKNLPSGSVEVKIKEEKTTLWSYFGFDGGKKQNEKKVVKSKWDVWVENNPGLTSIGDIWDKCDNKTRTKIGKVVLEANKGDEGVKIISYVNQTYTYTITKSTGFMKVYYKDSLLYDKEYDMCVKSLKLDTPYSCPILAGKTLIIRDAAKMPSYIPKGQYRISASILDQDGNEIGCTYAKFKTGE